MAEDTPTFAGKIFTVLNNSFLAMGLELGTRLGIIDYLIKTDKPQSSDEIAKGMGFKERYVREWLGLMTTGGIVDVADGKFSIPPHRVPVLSSTSPENSANFSWLSSICAGVTDGLMECFKLDGPQGLSYAKFPMFHPWREYSMNIIYTEEEMMRSIDMVPGLLEKLENGITMCDLGCSTGVITLKFAQKFPKSTVYGYDISKDSLTFAKEKAAKLGLTNVHFEYQDCCNMPADWSEKWEYIHVYDVVHDVPQSAKFLSEIHRCLKPGFASTIVDINMHKNVANNVTVPYAPLVYGISLFHCMTVSLAADGMGLGAAWGVEKATEMMKAAGFTKVELKTFEHSFQANFACFREK